MGSISKLSDEIIASIFAYGADIRIGEPRDEPEQTRMKYLDRCSLVCRAWRNEAQRLLFQQPFINSVDGFADFTRAARDKGCTAVVTRAVLHCYDRKQDKWIDALAAFLREFNRIEYLDLRSRAGNHKVELDWFAPIAGTLRTLAIRHFRVMSPLATLELSFPATRTLILDHGEFPILGRKDTKSPFALFPSLTTLSWTDIPLEKKTFAAKLKASLLAPPPRKVRGQPTPPPLPLLPHLTSLTLTSYSTTADDLLTRDHIRELLAAVPPLLHLTISLDLIVSSSPLLLPPSLHTLSLTRTYSPTPLTSLECPLIASLLPTLPSLSLLTGCEMWLREGKLSPSHLSAYAALKTLCRDRGITYERPEGGFGDKDDFTAWYAWVKEPPELVGEEYGVREGDERERGMRKGETLVHWRKWLQRAFLGPGGVREEDLEESAKYLYWMQGWYLPDFDLDCKLLYVLNRIVRLPDGAIPQAAEDKYEFRCTAALIAKAQCGLENADGEVEM